MLKFSPANAKTERLHDIEELAPYLDNEGKVYSLDLSAGWTCPGAKDCLAKVVYENGTRRIKDGKHSQFRCFSASQEVQYPNVEKARKHNMDILKGKGVNQIVKQLIHGMPHDARVIRWHVSGDFFSMSYLKAAIELARVFPYIRFYGYTKSLHFIKDIKSECEDLSNGIIKENFLITASIGGRYDNLIKPLKIRAANVVFDESHTELPIDHDDSHAATVGGSFSLLLHNTQPAGTPAAEAWSNIKRKQGGYRR